MSNPRVQSESVNRDEAAETTVSRGPSITNAVFVYWVVPVLVVAVLSRFSIDTGPPTPPQPQRPVSFNPKEARPTGSPSSSSPSFYSAADKPVKPPSVIPSSLSNKPSSYQEVISAIGRRRLDWSSTSYDESDVSPRAKSAVNGSPVDRYASHHQHLHTEEPPRGPSSDPVRMKLMNSIKELRREHKANPDDLLRAINLADALRLYDVQYHDGGTAQEEAVGTYWKAIEIAVAKRMAMLEDGEETNRSLSGTIDLNEEMTLDYSARSIDGILCALHTALGKAYFMANMFEQAVQSYDRALQIEPYYLDAMSSRGSSRIILGLYAEAAQDFTTVMERDSNRRFQDVFTGLARVLQTKENVVPGGWDPMIRTLTDLIPTIESQANIIDIQEGKEMLAKTLNRFYHVLFVYHDSETHDTTAAWDSLTKAYNYKMSALPKWNVGFETQKIAATKQIFHRGFWPAGVGSASDVPIFVIGFVRSGSTLLERVLDSHPQIVGTGENSVFNGQLDAIRNKIVETSLSGDPGELARVIESLADGVVEEMRERWKMVSAAEERASGRQSPLRFVDKMLTNYYNVGFIHMLFPNALILHVAREPMDTVFSAYKHEFPPGPLDYTSDFKSLAELYQGYRDLMEHWDRELPGRVTHIRYEDMVNDMPQVAKAIIHSAALDWDEGVLDFHKKKHAVNTLSTTQVRKGVYRDSLQAWRKYEKHLQPLVDLLGERTNYDLRTSLPQFVTHSSADEDGSNAGTGSDEREGMEVSRSGQESVPSSAEEL